ncbi:hypothetical protein BKA67DRAFT_665122 [Truncatella angustata]|uniref:Uncharacterized protein n=1 Tax=Truncatella angustata TaxID=152316 RepID=A0A9P8REU8_9PEZI|nr:uncharacterized protein BKA67DRAFT_665122 [Truncatella angustata]KAH6643302.1 hypothetical protein BKA67DRAFT_665122 [Truncatella angustata]
MTSVSSAEPIVMDTADRADHVDLLKGPVRLNQQPEDFEALEEDRQADTSHNTDIGPQEDGLEASKSQPCEKDENRILPAPIPRTPLPSLSPEIFLQLRDTCAEPRCQETPCKFRDFCPRHRNQRQKEKRRAAYVAGESVRQCAIQDCDQATTFDSRLCKNHGNLRTSIYMWRKSVFAPRKSKTGICLACSKDTVDLLYCATCTARVEQYMERTSVGSQSEPTVSSENGSSSSTVVQEHSDADHVDNPPPISPGYSKVVGSLAAAMDSILTDCGTASNQDSQDAAQPEPETKPFRRIKISDLLN